MWISQPNWVVFERVTSDGAMAAVHVTKVPKRESAVLRLWRLRTIVGLSLRVAQVKLLLRLRSSGVQSCI